MTSKQVPLTGATGNVGAVILEQLLASNPHTMIIALRNAGKQIPLFHVKFPSETSSGRLAFTSIPDMTIPGAFDSAASTVTYIIHWATPLADESGDGDWVKSMAAPTWAIDHNILQAAKQSPRVKRVIICGTLLQAIDMANLFDPSATMADATYNRTTFEEGKNGPWRNAYMHSKTNVERKTWAWYEEEGGKEGVGFDIVMLLPPSITGRSPQVEFRPSGDGPRGVPRTYHALMEGGTAADLDAAFPIIMDTDDVARVHVLSLDADKVPGNQRYLLASREIVDLRAIAARFWREYPKLAERLPDVEVDEEGFRDRTAKWARVDTGKSDGIFGTGGRARMIVSERLSWMR